MIIPLLLALSVAVDPLPPASEDEPIQVPEAELARYWVPLRSPSPGYPRSQRRHRTEGCVRLGFIIEPNGRVGFVETLFSVPPAVFERNAHRALRRWRYEAVTDPAPAEPIYTTHTMVFFLGKSPQMRGDPATLCQPPAAESD